MLLKQVAADIYFIYAKISQSPCLHETLVTAELTIRNVRYEILIVTDYRRR